MVLLKQMNILYIYINKYIFTTRFLIKKTCHKHKIKLQDINNFLLFLFYLIKGQ